MSKNSNKVSVILPTYNEAGNIVPLIDAIHSEIKDYEHEIIVVDDNSPDGTYQIVLDLGYPFAKAICRTSDPGFAKSIRYGLENAKGNLFVIMDSDFNHQPKYVLFMIQALSFYDCVIGSRFLYGGRGLNNKRHLLSWSFNIFLRLITDGAITDSLYGFVAIRREVIERCNYEDIFWGFGDYCIRLIYYIQKNNDTILQVPMIDGMRRAGRANRLSLRVVIQYTVTVIKLVLEEGRLGFCRKKNLVIK